MCVIHIVIGYNNILICNYVYNSYKILNNIYILLSIYYKYIYIYIYVTTCICKNNINYKIIYNKKRKMKNVYIYILLYSMCITKLLINYNTEDIQISVIIKYIYIICM